jgi:hypothetical protein
MGTGFKIKSIGPESPTAMPCENVVVGTHNCRSVPDSANAAFTGNSWPANPHWARGDAEMLAQAMLDKVSI